MLTNSTETATLTSYGNDPALKRTFNKDYPEPKVLVLVYCSFANDGLHVDQFEVELAGKKIEQIERDLVAAIQAGTVTGRKPVGNFDVVFNVPCYYTIVFDERGWSFASPPLTFIEKKDGRVFLPNFSFYNTEIVADPNYLAVRCVNFGSIDESGTPKWSYKKDYYCININLRVPLSMSTTGEMLTISIDPPHENPGTPPPPSLGSDAASK